MNVPVLTIPCLEKVRSPEFKSLNLDGFCSYWHYMPLAAHVCALVKPKNIFEIGFFLGASSYCWLKNSDARVVSCDLIANPLNLICIKNSQGLSEHFNNRLLFIPKSSDFIYDDVKHIQFDMAFIDGRHEADGFINDMEVCSRLKIPYLLLDDYNGAVRSIYESRYASLYPPVEGYSLENPPITNPIDCLLCKRAGV